MEKLTKTLVTGSYELDFVFKGTGFDYKSLFVCSVQSLFTYNVGLSSILINSLC